VSIKYRVPLSNTAASRGHGRGRGRAVFIRGHAPHGLRLLVVAPLPVRTGDEFAARVPADHPREAVVEAKEEAALRLLASFSQVHAVVAAALLHVGGEQVLVHDAAVHHGPGLLLVLLGAVSADEVPSAVGDVAVGPWHGRLPVLVLGWVAVDASALVEPVQGADDVSEAYEDVWGHGWAFVLTVHERVNRQC
jgi:hypothetical protein